MKIIKLTEDNDCTCLICCNKPSTVKFQIVRPKYDDDIISFKVCDECLAQMQKDIEACE